MYKEFEKEPFRWFLCDHDDGCTGAWKECETCGKNPACEQNDTPNLNKGDKKYFVMMIIDMQNDYANDGPTNTTSLSKWGLDMKNLAHRVARAYKAAESELQKKDAGWDLVVSTKDFLDDHDLNYEARHDDDGRLLQDPPVPAQFTLSPNTAGSQSVFFDDGAIKLFDQASDEPSIGIFKESLSECTWNNQSSQQSKLSQQSVSLCHFDFTKDKDDWSNALEHHYALNHEGNKVPKWYRENGINRDRVGSLKRNFCS